MVMSQTSLKDLRAAGSAGTAVTVISTLFFEGFFEGSASFLRRAEPKSTRSRFREPTGRVLGTSAAVLRYSTSVKSGGMADRARKGPDRLVCVPEYPTKASGEEP